MQCSCSFALLSIWWGWGGKLERHPKLAWWEACILILWMEEMKQFIVSKVVPSEAQECCLLDGAWRRDPSNRKFWIDYGGTCQAEVSKGECRSGSWSPCALTLGSVQWGGHLQENLPRRNYGQSKQKDSYASRLKRSWESFPLPFSSRFNTTVKPEFGRLRRLENNSVPIFPEASELVLCLSSIRLDFKTKEWIGNHDLVKEQKRATWPGTLLKAKIGEKIPNPQIKNLYYFWFHYSFCCCCLFVLPHSYQKWYSLV